MFVELEVATVVGHPVDSVHIVERCVPFTDTESNVHVVMHVRLCFSGSIHSEHNTT